MRAAAAAATATSAALSSFPSLSQLPTLPGFPGMSWLRDGAYALTSRLQNLLYHTHDDIVLRLDEGEDDDLLVVGNMPVQAMSDYKPLFLGYYTADDIRSKLLSHVSRFPGHYGKTIGEILREKGFGEILVDIDASDTFVHRLHFYHTVKDQRHLIGQLFIRIDSAFSVQTMKSTEAPEGAPADYREAFADGLHFLRRSFGASMLQLSVIEWLRVQDPLHDFGGGVLPLPGQLRPNLGIGHEINDHLATTARSRGRDGLMNIPEHWHNALMYSSAEPPFRFLNPAFEGFFQATRKAVADDIRTHGLPAVAWAIHKGQLMFRGKERVKWVPHEQVFPLTRRLCDYFETREYRDRVQANFHPEDFRIMWNLPPDPVALGITSPEALRHTRSLSFGSSEQAVPISIEKEAENTADNGVSCSVTRRMPMPPQLDLRQSCPSFVPQSTEETTAKQ